MDGVFVNLHNKDFVSDGCSTNRRAYDSPPVEHQYSTNIPTAGEERANTGQVYDDVHKDGDSQNTLQSPTPANRVVYNTIVDLPKNVQDPNSSFEHNTDKTDH